MSEEDELEGDIPTPHSAELTQAQNESLQHLREIAGNIDDDVAVKMLEENGWNLEVTVNNLFGVPETPVESTVRRRNDVGTGPPIPQVNLVPPNQRVLRASETYYGSWWWSFLMLLEPIRFTYQLLAGFVRFFASFLWPDPREQVTDPGGDVRRFISSFKSTYCATDSSSPGDPNQPTSDQNLSTCNKPTNPPPFYEGTYAQALQEAKRSLRFLIVYLHGDSHEDTNSFCINTLLNEEVVRFLSNAEEVLFWGCNIKSPEGYRVSRTLREHTYPFVGVIGLTNLAVSDHTPYPVTNVGMALLGRIEGAVSPVELIHQLSTILQEHQGVTLAARMDRQEREATARIRREQDLAYAESLAQDRAKMAAKAAEVRNAELQAAKAVREQERKQVLARAREARRLRWRRCLPTPPAPGAPDTVQLSIKLPNGSRASRVFSIYDSVKMLYYFVLTQDAAPENFEVQSNFPKRLIPCQPSHESDLEDYVTEKVSNLITTDETEPNVEGISSSTTTDWTPKPGGSDPPSFNELNLRKPEVLFIIDKDA